MAIAGNAQQLHVKSFFAATVKEALGQAHRELGPDALLLKTREAPPEARHLGACEVVLGVARQTGVAQPQSAPIPAGDGSSCRQKGTIDDALVELRAFMRTLPTPARDSQVEQALIEAGVVAEMAHQIDQAVHQRVHRGPVVAMSRPGCARPRDVAAETATEIASRLDVQPGLSRVTALVGPPGAGKTTTLVKLAVMEGLRAGRPTRLISADTQRIGGAEQLRTYAAILGVPFQAVESAAALAQAIDAASPRDLVLIDTPGYSNVLQSELGADLADFLSRRQDVDTHVVLTASTQPSVLRKSIELYRAYRPVRLLFTRLDEVESLGSVYCEAVQQHMPLSYFGTGQLIPEDLEAATKERVTQSLVRQLPADWRAVA